MPELTRDEINQLIDAVETWSQTNEAPSNHMLSMMIGSIGNAEKSKEVAAALNEEMRRKAKARREQGILLQAKLIQLRDKADINEAAQFLRNGDR